ncbi:MAG: hypothetical protein WAK95_16870 [Desulfobacterales bacterium]
MRTLLEVGLTIMADTSRENSTAGCAVSGFKHIVKLPSTIAHALAVMVRLIASYQQAARQNGATQSATNATAISQCYAERSRNSNGLSVTKTAVKGLVQGHYDRLGAQQLPGLVQIFCTLFNSCDQRLSLRIVIVPPLWHQYNPPI